MLFISNSALTVIIIICFMGANVLTKMYFDTFSAVAKAVLDRCMDLRKVGKEGSKQEDTCTGWWQSAKAVMDCCMDLLKVGKEGSKQEDTCTADNEQYKVEFDYEFLDDYCDNQVCQKHHASEDSGRVDGARLKDKLAKNKGFVADWGPKSFSRRKHPLALMVSWLNCTSNSMLYGKLMVNLIVKLLSIRREKHFLDKNWI